MDKTEFLTIFPTFENLDVVKQTLPSVIAETKRNDARLIVHDSSELGREEKWEYLKELNKSNDFFLLLSTNLSMAHARNMCLQLGQELYIPDYICMIEDDHGFNEGLIPNMIEAMKTYYGKTSPNNLKYGMFTACFKHSNADLVKLNSQYAYPSPNNVPFDLGGFNSCFRCSPTSHWCQVLKGYDTDEYLISNYQTAQLRWRNYHKGFTTMFVGNGDLVFSIDEGGRGEGAPQGVRLWDKEFSARDLRSIYIGKDRFLVTPEVEMLREKYFKKDKEDGIKNKFLKSISTITKIGK